ncbi:hypothetical protein HW555_001985 [Spodoptera exigua]|uniref:CUE domain-containing protein n=1 Tax=Spodoptera exigua TaxID=7107 RepID=A0A835GPQ7_SPOEX|nr:hypothetical protein HW555_001985 [Spodoptera exigua]
MSCLLATIEYNWAFAMPVTLIDRLPLPNLKVYTAGSVSLLSIAVYYALSVTSDPNWRANSTIGRQDSSESGQGEQRPIPAQLLTNGTRNVSEQFVDVITFMMQEPLCMWTLINIAYCSLAVFGFAVQRLVFGPLRVAEAQRVKDKFWNYVFYKFIFVFGVINVQYMDEVLLWCSWFTLVGFLHLLAQLCKDRYEYLSSSPNTGGWAHAAALVAELAHVVHMVAHSNMLQRRSREEPGQLCHLLGANEGGSKAALLAPVSQFVPVPVGAARRVVPDMSARVGRRAGRSAPGRRAPPQSSVPFRRSCLCQWVQQDASCPTCRRALAAGPAAPRQDAARHPNHLFHFDGSRYVSWLPSFSVEVTRVRPDAGGAALDAAGAQLDAAAAQLQLMFPQHSRAALAADLQRTRSADLTLDNILEGRLPAAPAPRAAAPAPRPPPPPPERADAAGSDDAGRFSRCAAEREAQLRRRKQQLLEAARRRYLARLAPRS